VGQCGTGHLTAGGICSILAVRCCLIQYPLHLANYQVIIGFGNITLDIFQDTDVALGVCSSPTSTAKNQT